MSGVIGYRNSALSIGCLAEPIQIKQSQIVADLP